MGRLEDKVAIVTASHRGIGKAVAIAFGEEGARVVVACREREAAEVVAEEIRAAGGRAVGVACDIGSKEQIVAMIAQAAEDFGPIDILVNGPQVSASETPLERCGEDEWDRTLREGAKSTLLAMQAVFPYMQNRGGKIINFGSLEGQVGEPGSVAANANSEAVRAVTRTAAREWGRYQIYANVIDPLAAASPEKASPERLGWHAEEIPMGRLAEPSEIGRVAVFLASEDSDAITGMTVKVDGGLGMFA